MVFSINNNTANGDKSQLLSYNNYNDYKILAFDKIPTFIFDGSYQCLEDFLLGQSNSGKRLWLFMSYESRSGIRRHYLEFIASCIGVEVRQLKRLLNQFVAAQVFVKVSRQHKASLFGLNPVLERHSFRMRYTDLENKLLSSSRTFAKSMSKMSYHYNILLPGNKLVSESENLSPKSNQSINQKSALPVVSFIRLREVRAVKAGATSISYHFLSNNKPHQREGASLVRASKQAERISHSFSFNQSSINQSISSKDFTDGRASRREVVTCYKRFAIRSIKSPSEMRLAASLAVTGIQARDTLLVNFFGKVPR